MNKKQWAKKRNELRERVRRSGKVSDGAFRLWDELATGWAWGSDHKAFPKISMLEDALGKSRTTIKRHLATLIELGLVETQRRSRGSVYVLATECPASLGPPVTNRDLATAHRKRSSPKATGDGPNVDHHEAGDGPDSDHHSEDDAKCDGPDVDHRDGPDSDHHKSDGPDVDHRDGPDVDHPYKPSKESLNSSTKAITRKPKRDSSSHASSDNSGTISSPSRSALGNEHTGADGEIMSYAEDNELEGLIEDPCPRPRRKRAADPNLVPGAGRKGKVPFPEAQGALESLDFVNFEPGYASPPPETPEELVRLLRDESVSKWGKEAAEGFSLELSGKLSGQLRNTIITKFSARQIQSMVRLLVWDWEVARGECFPFRPNQPFPDALALVQYASDLANRITSGFVYPNARRGDANTYKRLFIDKRERVEDDDPF